ncbi:substrate-binding domain-containing protein [Cryobacterium roopkundense]|uniref:ABC-type sugar transport system substrate-binding protein n=1 Tax=Cryobacterium roopkundense TaxID=1001240 RepID=A0A7W8ZZG6_9MICO|nr:substrate-binding domain-containing protein [Cryobacterium roopkundense]MBB5642765.1 ABC-type sugar transport system substrate-binding protein [Cryobacterium roopkundense]
MNSFTRTAGAVAVAATLVLGASACSTETTPASTTTADGAAGLTIAFVMGAEADPFFKAMKVGADAEIAAKGDTLIWQGDPSVYSPATQIPIVDQVLAQKPDCLVLIPTDPDALQASVTKATAAGIPVVNVDTHVTDLSDVVSFITGDNTQGGAAAADAMATAIGYTDGGSYEVVVGLTSETATTNVSRLEGFQEQVAAKYPGIEIVDTAYSQSQAATANSNVSNWLTKYPDLAGIFAIDGTNATGASSALQAKGLTGKVALVGYDAYKDNVDLLTEGVFTALVAQDPATEAKQAIDTCHQYIESGNSKDGITAEVTLPNIVLDKSTSTADLAKYTYVQ